MDRWKAKELKSMELGGNKLAQAYYEKNGMLNADGTPNHKAPQLAKYKQELAKRAEVAIVGATGGITQITNGGITNGGVAQIEKPEKVVQQMSSLTFATSSNKEDIFGSFKTLEENKSADRVAESSGQPKLVSLASNKSSSDGGIALFGLGKQAAPAEVKTLNAKKLDINFDTDDFFNSFQPQQPSQQSTLGGTAPSKSTKLQQVDDPFEIAPAKAAVTSSKPPMHFQGSSSDLDQQAKERLYQLGNKKAISSADVFGQQEQKSQEVQQRYQQLAGAKAISSDMFFGRKSQPNGSDKDLGDQVEGYLMGRSSVNSGNSYEEYRQQAVQMAEKVQEGAKVLKDKALDWLSTFSTGQ
ncbi:hypothetical protein FGO68_gene2700 [Halteria grandinella]|uniref:Uncharacterized protein n=1 Tax=Halteria grandinella TaxID=5974 RepID=A0A8J8T1S8_HALGN|nr:hypothetical protein FGO68_gene2700 [Halteria grandinella]